MSNMCGNFNGHYNTDKHLDVQLCLEKAQILNFKQKQPLTTIFNATEFARSMYIASVCLVANEQRTFTTLANPVFQSLVNYLQCLLISTVIYTRTKGLVMDARDSLFVDLLA